MASGAGPIELMDGIRFHWLTSARSYARADGLSVPDEFHERLIYTKRKTSGAVAKAAREP